MNGENPIVYEVREGVATITLNRPERKNALNTRLRGALLESVNAANADASVRVVVVTGTGNVFCAGADLSDKRPPGYTLQQQIDQEYNPLLLAIAYSPKLYIAALNGPAVGAGAGLALTADFCVMTRQAVLSIAFVGIGLGPDMGISWWLSRQLGTRRALELIVAAEKISADRCLQLGLANRVVEAETLMQETYTWARQIAGGAPLAQQNSKALVGRAQHSSLEETVRLEAEMQEHIIHSEDAQEAISAFLQKRKPVFKGR